MPKKELGPGADLNLFRWGPHHHEMYTVDELLYGQPSCAPWICEYQWTPETVVGSESGRIARVWVHVSSL